MTFVKTFRWRFKVVQFFASNVGAHHLTLLQHLKETIVILALVLAI